MLKARIALIAAAVATLAAFSAAADDDAALIHFDATTDSREYCRMVLNALTREDFGILEATAARGRSLENRFPGSKTELQVFYQSFVKDSCGQRYVGLTEEVGKARIALAQRWREEMPDSLTAKVASARLWQQYAWVGRGGGFANEVSPAEWETFSDRLKQSADLMRTVDPDRDPEAYLLLLNLSRDFSLPLPQIDAIFQRAHQRFPTYLAYYADYASLLLPEWFGQPGDLADYMKSLLGDPGGDLGAIAYARAAERLAWDMGSSTIYRDAGMTWDDVRHGFALRESRDGLDKSGWITLCYYAVMAGDRDAARAAYSHVSEIDEWPVGGTQQFFLEVLPWIMARD